MNEERPPGSEGTKQCKGFIEHRFTQSVIHFVQHIIMGYLPSEGLLMRIEMLRVRCGVIHVKQQENFGWYVSGTFSIATLL